LSPRTHWSNCANPKRPQSASGFNFVPTKAAAPTFGLSRRQREQQRQRRYEIVRSVFAEGAEGLGRCGLPQGLDHLFACVELRSGLMTMEERLAAMDLVAEAAMGAALAPPGAPGEGLVASCLAELGQRVPALGLQPPLTAAQAPTKARAKKKQARFDDVCPCGSSFVAGAAFCAFCGQSRRGGTANPVGAPEPPILRVYEGVTEHEYRLLFDYADKYSAHPEVRTVLPSGAVVGMGRLTPLAEEGLLAFAHPQDISASAAVPHLGSAFVWPRGDSTHAVMQIWPVKCDSSFRESYELATANPDVTRWVPQAAAEFKKVMIELFGDDAVLHPVLYAHRATTCNRCAYVGTAEQLQALLRANSDLVKDFNISELTPNGFVAKWQGLDGREGEMEFVFSPGETYVLYTKVGSETLTCIKAKWQFDAECCVLHEEVRSSPQPSPPSAAPMPPEQWPPPVAAPTCDGSVGTCNAATMLHVEAPAIYGGLAGTFRMMFICNNGYPMWQQVKGSAVIWSGSSGRWQFSPHFVQSTAPHARRPPHEVDAWEAWDESAQAWLPYPSFGVVAVALPGGVEMGPDEYCEC